MGVTTDPHDGCLHEIDPLTNMQKCYLVLPDGKREDLVRPVRRTYIHTVCRSMTIMGQALSETYAANPSFYSGTYCANCRDHFPVGEHGEFVWEDGTKVGT